MESTDGDLKNLINNISYLLANPSPIEDRYLLLEISKFEQFLSLFEKDDLRVVLKRLLTAPPPKNEHDAFREWLNIKMTERKFKPGSILREVNIEPTRFSKLIKGTYRTFHENEYDDLVIFFEKDSLKSESLE